MPSSTKADGNVSPEKAVMPSANLEFLVLHYRYLVFWKLLGNTKRNPFVLWCQRKSKYPCIFISDGKLETARSFGEMGLLIWQENLVCFDSAMFVNTNN